VGVFGLAQSIGQALVLGVKVAMLLFDNIAKGVVFKANVVLVVVGFLVVVVAGNVRVSPASRCLATLF